LLLARWGEPDLALAERTSSSSEQWYDLSVPKPYAQITLLLSAGLVASCRGLSPAAPRSAGSREIDPLIRDVRQGSFPQLASADIEVYDLRSDFDYLQARFTVSSFFTRKLRYMILFNSDAILRQVPAEGLRAIVAHELAHINYYESQSWMGLVSLVGLLLPSFTARFERKADLDAIALGYGPGLEIYRTWLYRNIPREAEGEKKRDYYAPQEIEALLQAETKHPGIMSKFRRCIPRNLGEITQEEVAPAADCPK